MPVATYTVQRPEGGDDTFADAHLRLRLPVTAGPHEVAATFLKDSASLIETERQPLLSHFNEQRHPRLTPAIYQVTITGPHDAQGVSDTPSRARIFSCQPSSTADEESCARGILSTLMRRAYRRAARHACLRSSARRVRSGYTSCTTTQGAPIPQSGSSRSAQGQTASSATSCSTCRLAAASSRRRWPGPAGSRRSRGRAWRRRGAVKRSREASRSRAEVAARPPRPKWGLCDRRASATCAAAPTLAAQALA